MIKIWLRKFVFFTKHYFRSVYYDIMLQVFWGIVFFFTVRIFKSYDTYFYLAFKRTIL